MKILVVIVSYKDGGNLKECMGSLRALGLDLDVYVHDNSKINLGFAGGVNSELKKCLIKVKIPACAGMTSREKKYDWVWLLNPDCRIEVKGVLEDFRGLYRNSFDVWSPVVYDEHGKIWFAGGKINRITGECEHIKIQNSINNKGDKGNVGNRGWDTKWISGCSMFVKPRVFERIGFFDEKFFLFYEDVDFCLRAREAGFRIGMVGTGEVGSLGGIGNLRIIHKVSRSVNKLPNKYEIEMKSKFYLLRKHKDYFFPTAMVISKFRYFKHKLIKGV